MAKKDKTKPPTDYPVGYGKPPKNTRFQKGQSGNPKGRPKGSLNSATVAARTARQPVVINENGQRKIITVLELVYKQLASKAVSGDVRAADTFLEKIETGEQRLQEAAKPSARLDDADQKIVKGMLERFKRSLKGESDK